MTVPTQTPSGEPRRLGSAYVLTSLIGTGAQGEVWLGNRVSDPASSLAVKLLRADLLQDPGVIERFVRERATLMRVRSPYVVGVRDMVIEGTSFAIVMDFVDGGDLRELLAARCASEGVRLIIPKFTLCTDNGAMVAALGARLVTAGREPSGVDFTTDSSLPVTTVCF